MATSNSSPVQFIGQGHSQSLTTRSKLCRTGSAYFCGFSRVLSADISLLEAGEPLTTFTSKWREVRSRLRCQERGTR
jgi:hypothetical protein